jgi:hypothetical protein
MDLLQGLRVRRPRPRRVPGPDAVSAALSWIGDERIAVSGVPSPQAVAHLAEQGGDARGQLPAAGAGAVVRGIWRPSGPPSAPGGLRTPRCRITAAGSGPRRGRRPRASPRGCWTISRGHRCSFTAARAGAVRPARLCGAPAARARSDPGGRAGAALPAPGTAGPGLCTQRRAVACHGRPVTSATAPSWRRPPTRSGLQPGSTHALPPF